MSNTLPARFFRAAVIYGLLGMALGIHMAATHDHGQLVAHAHLLLIGWVSMFLFGGFYHLYAPSDRLGHWQWWISNVGVIVLTAGLLVIYGGNPARGEPFATAGSLITIAGMALFAYNVFRLTRAGASEKAALESGQQA